jgi:hypothetical protein
MELVLPTEKVAALRKSPRHMIIYGPPKVGKTTALAKLEGCLIIDLEQGSDMIEALKVKAANLKELGEIGKAIMKAGKPYKYIAIDTLTQLEVWCESDAKELYRQTPMGKNFDTDNKGLSVLSLPNGAGYLYLRMAIKKWMDRLETLSDHIIYIGHLKDKQIEKKGKEVSAKDLDLTGKIRSIACANSDAIGYVYRNEDKTMISFNSSDDITAGSRCEHLRGQEIELDWSKIYID